MPALANSRSGVYENSGRGVRIGPETVYENHRDRHPVAVAPPRVVPEALVGNAKMHRRPEASERLRSLLELGDPHAEVAIAYRIKERLRDFYRAGDANQARQMLEDLKDHCLKRVMPPEVQKLGRTLERWFDIGNYYWPRSPMGPLRRPKTW